MGFAGSRRANMWGASRRSGIKFIPASLEILSLARKTTASDFENCVSHRSMSHTLLHETLGTKLVGVEVASVLQFRGIPYGRIPARFARPELVEDLPRELDCTSFG